MAVEFIENKAIFKNTVTIEEAEAVFEWLLREKDVEVDMIECEHIHTAVFQILAILKPKILLPKDEELKKWIELLGG